tara:strand:- start:1017 stop:1733 length:717 start_codon:yes stop_codon:yes gene_type:complete
MTEIPGIKKYSNDNPFLNSINDLSRAAYSNHTKASVNNNPVNRFEADIILNSKEAFESNNLKINSLNEEIQELKKKLKTIYEKEEEIYKLKSEIKGLHRDIEKYENLQSEIDQLKIENKQLRDKNDRTQIEIMNNQSLKQENKLLKDKLKEYQSSDKTDIEKEDIEEIMTNDFKEEIERKTKEVIQINVPKLKDILYKRLKIYHEKHIDDLISTYNLDSKVSVEKETMEKILLEAIHI